MSNTIKTTKTKCSQINGNSNGTPEKITEWQKKTFPLDLSVTNINDHYGSEMYKNALLICVPVSNFEY